MNNPVEDCRNCDHRFRGITTDFDCYSPWRILGEKRIICGCYENSYALKLQQISVSKHLFRYGVHI